MYRHTRKDAIERLRPNHAGTAEEEAEQRRLSMTMSNETFVIFSFLPMHSKK